MQDHDRSSDTTGMPPETKAQSAEHVFTVQRLTMLDQIEKVGAAADRSEGTKGLMKESAVLQARAIDQSCFGMIFVAELLNERVDNLANRIDVATKASTASTDSMTTWTRRLVWATWALAIAAVLASLIQAFATITSTAQIINIPRP